jgi:hypothetical protein
VNEPNADKAQSQLLTDLIAVRELLSAPERWTKGYGARNSEGTPVDSFSPDACCWCLVGACARVTEANEAGNSGRFDVLRASLRPKAGPCLVRLNDAPERTHAEILAVIDKAIEKERAAA